MRVLLVTDWMSNPGGVELYVGWLRDGLRAAGDDVRLLTSSVATPSRDGADYVAYGSERLAAQALLQIVNPFAAARLRTARREFRPDVVHLFMIEHQPVAGRLGALGPTPSV